MRFQRAEVFAISCIRRPSREPKLTKDSIEGISLHPNDLVKLSPPVKLSSRHISSLTRFDAESKDSHIPCSPLLQARAGRPANAPSGRTDCRRHIRQESIREARHRRKQSRRCRSRYFVRSKPKSYQPKGTNLWMHTYKITCMSIA